MTAAARDCPKTASAGAKKRRQQHRPAQTAHNSGTTRLKTSPRRAPNLRRRRDGEGGDGWHGMREKFGDNRAEAIVDEDHARAVVLCPIDVVAVGEEFARW